MTISPAQTVAAQLEALIDKVTPGEWQAHNSQVYCNDATGQRVADCRGEFLFWPPEQVAFNADWIALISPANIRTLLTALREAERERDEALEDIGRVILACPMQSGMRTSPAHEGVRALRSAFEASESTVERLTRELEQTREALKPFASEASEVATAIPDHARYILDGHPDLGQSDFDVGDLRHAAKALEPRS